jgi:hypothetical protein
VQQTGEFFDQFSPLLVEHFECSPDFGDAILAPVFSNIGGR